MPNMDKPKWSKPKLSPSRRKPTLGQRAEAQRRGMATTRKKATAKRPTRPITPQQLSAVRQRDRDMRQDAAGRSKLMKRSRERMRYQGQ
jgi:hypothetical protein